MGLHMLIPSSQQRLNTFPFYNLSHKKIYDALIANASSLHPYSDGNGSTWGIKVPVGTRHIYEGEGKLFKFREAYPDFYKWLGSKGAAYKDWYLHPDDEKIVKAW